MRLLGLRGGQKLQPGFCLQDSGSASELKAAESQVTREVFKAALRACRRDQARSGALEHAVDSISLQVRRRRGEDEKKREKKRKERGGEEKGAAGVSREPQESSIHPSSHLRISGHHGLVLLLKVLRTFMSV